MEDQMEKLKQSRDRLKSALSRQMPVVEERAQIIQRLEQLLNRSVAAVQITQKAMEDARQHQKDLQGE